ncbi:hypothetical protein MNBD_GAMMA01-1307 [hydrothermal vent metagenome]|uniref:Uncharacterized protein n=1 Tax=hydrothermal vent metagenome TaxID=652676 RepID=A0A3B0VE44_9ZZZZ
MIRNVFLKAGSVSPDNLHHDSYGFKLRVMTFFASCKHLRYSKRMIVGMRHISILTLYMRGDLLGHGEKEWFV